MLGAARTFLPSLLLVGVVALAGELVLARQLSAGQMVAFYGYATYLVLPTTQVTFAVTKAMQAHVAAENVTRLLRMKPDIETCPGPVTMTPGRCAASSTRPTAWATPMTRCGPPSTRPPHGTSSKRCRISSAPAWPREARGCPAASSSACGWSAR
jgi:ABC-type multidrug transport system fused ATPase/permease subunit